MKKKNYKIFLFLGILLLVFYPSNALSWIDPGGGGGGGGNPSKKYAFFLWTSEIGTQSIIDGYENVLRSKGYTTYDWKDANINTIFSFIYGIEDFNDKLFFYFSGHGEYLNGKSYVHYTPTHKLSSSLMKLYLDNLDAPDVSILIDSCFAGEFVDRFANSNGYLVMTSSDEYHKSFYNSITMEHCFSRTFWWDLILWPEHSATDSFYVAKLAHWWYYPQIVDNSNYNFF